MPCHTSVPLPWLLKSRVQIDLPGGALACLELHARDNLINTKYLSELSESTLDSTCNFYSSIALGGWQLPADRASVPVSSLPLVSGDTIVVRELPGPPPPAPAVAPAMVTA
eukprot:scaffold576_cov39-Tisochrysis_lutea.AAC.3